MVLVKQRSREGSVSERLRNVWLDDADSIRSRGQGSGLTVLSL